MSHFLYLSNQAHNDDEIRDLGFGCTFLQTKDVLKLSLGSILCCNDTVLLLLLGLKNNTTKNTWLVSGKEKCFGLKTWFVITNTTRNYSDSCFTLKNAFFV